VKPREPVNDRPATGTPRRIGYLITLRDGNPVGIRIEQLPERLNVPRSQRREDAPYELSPGDQEVGQQSGRLVSASGASSVVDGRCSTVLRL